jgi:hypothetical protein
MSKQQHIDYWINTAEDDWGSVELLFNGKKYLQLNKVKEIRKCLLGMLQ